MGNEARLVIDPVKRKISTKDEKIRLVQYDNNSVKIYFEIPRYVINHEMLDSSTVEVHFDNISSDRKQKNSDIYKVTDITVDREDENKVIFSWLVGKNATQLVGSVEIALHFGRTDDPEYAWHTTNYSGINVFEGKHNETPVVDMYPDAFYELKRELEQKIEDAVENIEPVELAQDLEGNAEDKAVSQAAVNAYKVLNDAGVDFLIGKVAEHEIALGGIYEEWKTENILDPDDAENGYYNVETDTLDKVNVSTHLRNKTAIPLEGKSEFYIRTLLPNTTENNDVGICVIQADTEGKKVAYRYMYVRHIHDAGGSIRIAAVSGASKLMVWTSGQTYGVTFADWCISFAPLDRFVSFGGGTRIKERDIIITTPPTAGYHPVPKDYADSRFISRVKTAWALYGTNGTPDENGNMGVRIVSLATVGTTANTVPTFKEPTSADFSAYPNPTCTIAVCDPIKPTQTANMRFVENSLAPLKRITETLQEAAVGTLYDTVEHTDSTMVINIPDNALRYMYVEDLGILYCMDGNGDVTGALPVEALTVNGETIVQRPHVPCYVQIPEGASSIECFAGEIPTGTEYTNVENIKIIFQVKVGG